MLESYAADLHILDYRKPLLQRYVVRILLMVPIYSAASWASVVSLQAAFYLDPLRDVYEAFTIYTFLQLLVNFVGGERSLIIMMHGRAPVSHPWPLNLYFSKVDISDPHTFLAMKRGILQYAYLKPVLATATIIFKLTDTYKEGYISLDSGYLWSGIVYNISITISLYALAMFWVCMSDDLQPFRPMPKFLCIKLIIFASYWQGFFLSILQFLGAIPSDFPGYSADNLAAAIQDTLICFEMPLFAIGHWYAFSWHDYADVTISSARMPVRFALRDSYGIRDLIEDTKHTFRGEHYDYRSFDSNDHIIAHEESHSRIARMEDGMRYERGGKGKYWIPKSAPNSKTPLLSGTGSKTSLAPESRGRAIDYRAAEPDLEIAIDAEDERLFTNARALEFGDWNYPVVTAHEASREDWMRRDPRMLTTSTNRHLIQPTKDHQIRRKRELRESIHKGKERSTSSKGSRSAIESKLRKDLHPEEQGTQELPNDTTDRDQLVDLVIEDHEAEEMEKVRARKEGGDRWNVGSPPRHFVRTYSVDGAEAGDTIRTDEFDPSKVPADPNPPEHAVSDEEDEGESSNSNGGRYGNLGENDNVWK